MDNKLRIFITYNNKEFSIDSLSTPILYLMQTLYIYSYMFVLGGMGARRYADYLIHPP